MFVTQDMVKDEAPGGVKGLIESANKKLNSFPLVKSTRAWCWWAFRKSGTVTWVVTTSSLLVLLPLILEVKGEFMIEEQEKIMQLQQQGYSQQQIEQMLGIPPQPQGVPQ